MYSVLPGGGADAPELNRLRRRRRDAVEFVCHLHEQAAAHSGRGMAVKRDQTTCMAWPW